MIRITANPEELAQAAAELIVEQAQAAVRDRGRFSMALAGGSTPQRAYEILARPPFRDRIPWRQIHLFWGDERCVPFRDPRSNAAMVCRALLDQVPIPASHIHQVNCAKSPHEAAREYEVLLRTFFAGHPAVFDLVLLGLGADGHTASLFPGTSALEERKRWVTEVCVTEQEIYRVTLTPLLINQARMVVFLVSGAAKAAVLRDIREGTADMPARLIRPARGELRWLVDREAAAMLSRTPEGTISEVEY
jgi:6-phosphogluconolactonase